MKSIEVYAPNEHYLIPNRGSVGFVINYYARQDMKPTRADGFCSIIYFLLMAGFK